MVNIFILQKISPERDRLQLFCTFAIILDKFSAPTSSNFFLWKIWVITDSKSAPNITWWVYWMRNRGLLLPNFLHFFYPVTLLTNSAVVNQSNFALTPPPTLFYLSPLACLINFSFSYYCEVLDVLTLHDQEYFPFQTYIKLMPRRKRYGKANIRWDRQAHVLLSGQMVLRIQNKINSDKHRGTWFLI